MKHGSILSWVEHLAERVGEVDGGKAESFVAREIMVITSILESILDEFHRRQ